MTGSRDSMLPTTDLVARGRSGMLRRSPRLATAALSSPKVTPGSTMEATRSNGSTRSTFFMPLRSTITAPASDGTVSP